jgi:hypothetical protein
MQDAGVEVGLMRGRRPGQVKGRPHGRRTAKPGQAPPAEDCSKFALALTTPNTCFFERKVVASAARRCRARPETLCLACHTCSCAWPCSIASSRDVCTTTPGIWRAADAMHTTIAGPFHIAYAYALLTPRYARVHVPFGQDIRSMLNNHRILFSMKTSIVILDPQMRPHLPQRYSILSPSA